MTLWVYCMQIVGPIIAQTNRSSVVTAAQTAAITRQEFALQMIDVWCNIIIITIIIIIIISRTQNNKVVQIFPSHLRYNTKLTPKHQNLIHILWNQKAIA